MRTVVFGKDIRNDYAVESNAKDVICKEGGYKKVFNGKPELVKNTQVVGWSQILSYDGRPIYNSKITLWDYSNTFNISEDEVVTVEKEIFRADLGEIHLHTNKVVHEEDNWKEYAENDYNELISKFNKQMIESNTKMKAYCDLHKLPYESTDCIELFKLVYPDDIMEIKDGVMLAINNTLTITSSTICGGTINGKMAWGINMVPTEGITTINKTSI